MVPPYKFYLSVVITPLKAEYFSLVPIGVRDRGDLLPWDPILVIF